MNNCIKENERLKTNVVDLNNSDIALNKSLDMFKGYLNDSKLLNDKNILIIDKNKDQIENLILKQKETNTIIQDLNSKIND